MVLDVSQDPSLRMLRSGFGKQVPSTASTVAAFGFGTAGRDSYQKVGSPCVGGQMSPPTPHVSFFSSKVTTQLLLILGRIQTYLMCYFCVPMLRSSIFLLNKPRRCREITVWEQSTSASIPSVLSRTQNSHLHQRQASGRLRVRSNTEASLRVQVCG